MTTKILVLPASTEIAYEIFRSLNGIKNLELIGASAVVDGPHKIIFNNCSYLPNATDNNFLKDLSNLIESQNIDYIFPAHDIVSVELAKNFEKISATIVQSPPSTIINLRSKLSTYQTLKDVVPIPITYSDNESEIKYPVFSKPDQGQGSQGAFKINNTDEYNHFFKNNYKRNDYIVCEYLPGEEYTIDCFTDNKGELRYSQARQRDLVRNGISVQSLIVTDNEKFSDIATKINNTLNLRGAWFYQVKEDANGVLKLMEVGPRIAGTMGLPRARGVNLAALSLFSIQGVDIEILESNKPKAISRCLENFFQKVVESPTNVYIDYDDIIYMEESYINPAIISYIIKFRNDGARIVLISKHSNDLNKSLEIYGIKGLFHKIIHIDATLKKTDFISEDLKNNPGDSLFIDDSFSERKAVSDKINIPTFDLSMLESF